MKKIYFTVSLLFVLAKCFSQAPFWTETFGTGCSAGTSANGLNASGNGSWTVVNSGPNDPTPNEWYISAAEAGMGAGNCGSDCNGPNGTNRTLHVGSPMGSDPGASYFSWPGNCNTDARAQSPVINCTGQNNISMTFQYILGGVPGVDYIQVQFSADGGTTWTTIATPAATNNTVCGGQGLWTAYTVALPATANNNNNVKIGFRWINTDATGADPSFAVDNVALNLTSFSPTFTLTNPVCAGSSVNLVANTGTYAVSGYTWAASPAGPVIASPNASATSITFTSAGMYSISLTATSGGTTMSVGNTITVNSNPTVNASALPANTLCSGSTLTLSASGANTYTWNPGNLTGSSVAVTPTVNTNYSVSATGTNNCTGSAAVSVTVSVCTGIHGFELSNASYNVYPNPAGEKLYLQISNLTNECTIEIYDLAGKILDEARFGSTPAGSVFSLNIGGLAPGIYFLKYTSGQEKKTLKFVKE